MRLMHRRRAVQLLQAAQLIVSQRPQSCLSSSQAATRLPAEGPSLADFITRAVVGAKDSAVALPLTMHHAVPAGAVDGSAAPSYYIVSGAPYCWAA